MCGKAKTGGQSHGAGALEPQRNDLAWSQRNRRPDGGSPKKPRWYRVWFAWTATWGENLRCMQSACKGTAVEVARRRLYCNALLRVAEAGERRSVSHPQVIKQG